MKKRYFYSILFVLFFLVILLACAAIEFVIGKHPEQDPILNKVHVFITFGVTILLDLSLIAVIVVNTAANLVSLSPIDSAERICSSLDNSGTGIIKVSLDAIGVVGQGNNL